MTFIVATLNHFRAVQLWAEANGADVRLNVKNFDLEIKAHNRYFTLKPRFLATIQARLAHVQSLTAEATGLIGWLPYGRPLRWDFASDKLTFKTFITQSGFKTPAWSLESKLVAEDYILKPSQGSFGYGLYGPYRANVNPSSVPDPGKAGQVFAEQFIYGRSVKLWFWGETAFFAHVQDYPTATGDGSSSVRELIAARLKLVGRDLDDSPESNVIRQVLAYQGLGLDHVPNLGDTLWLDYRYGRTFASSPVTPLSDNSLEQLPADARNQAHTLGRFLASTLLKLMPAPVLYSVDAVLDNEGTLWWLEMNSNPILPPDGYPLIFSTLFGEGRVQ